MFQLQFLAKIINRYLVFVHSNKQTKPTLDDTKPTTRYFKFTVLWPIFQSMSLKKSAHSIKTVLR